MISIAEKTKKCLMPVTFGSRNCGLFRREETIEPSGDLQGDEGHIAAIIVRKLQ